MRCLLFLLLLAALRINAQTVDTIGPAAWLFDLNFTTAEKDSMADGLKDNRSNFEKLHRQPIPNNLPYPYAFRPAPAGFAIPVKQLPVKWDIPSNVTVPANKEDLAFYSILQLASLMKNKKISSTELTKFFLARLKKWGDSLECVITITEELALKEAAQADEEIKRGR